MKQRLIARNNIKKSVVTSIVLLLLISLATILLYIGISTISRMNTFVEEKNEALNGADVVYFINEGMKKEAEDLVTELPNYKTSESGSALIFSTSVIKNERIKGKEETLPSIMLNAEEPHSISQIHLIGEAKERPENAIVLPYTLKVSNGYQTGDQITMSVNGTVYYFEVYGFYEDVIWGNPSNIAMYKMFVYDSMFQKLYVESDPAAKLSISNVLLKERGLGPEFENQVSAKVKEELGDKALYFQIVNYVTMRDGCVMFINILLVIFIAFALILLAIALVVIRFSILVQIEKEMQNIGSLEAIGYTTRQIISSVLLQFVTITFLGIVFGIGIATLLSNSVGLVISTSISLIWTSKFDILAMILSGCFVFLLVVVITYFTAKKIKRITPLVALRGGIETHNFKHNYLPLDRSKCSLNVNIGCKSLLHNMKQNIVIVFIVSLLTFASVYAVIMYYNFVVDTGGLLDLVGLETADMQIDSSQERSDTVYNELKKEEEVEKLIKCDMIDMQISSETNSLKIDIKVTNEFDELKVDTVFEGRHPLHDNEVVLSKRAMNELEVSLGDSVTIQYGGKPQQYLIVGISQHITRLGLGAELTEAGVRRMNSSYRVKSIFVYLTPGADVKQLTNQFERELSPLEAKVYNIKTSTESILASFRQSITMICIMSGAITAFVVMLILLLLIRIKIVKEQKNMGINKALGFTTAQLMKQIIAGFLPIILCGAVIGGGLAMGLGNKFTALMLASNGIMRTNFKVPYSYGFGVAFAVVAIGLVTIIVVSARVRKITPTKLFDE